MIEEGEKALDSAIYPYILLPCRPSSASLVNIDSFRTSLSNIYIAYTVVKRMHSFNTKGKVYYSALPIPSLYHLHVPKGTVPIKLTKNNNIVRKQSLTELCFREISEAVKGSKGTLLSYIAYTEA
jgi:hypothetical protein